MTSDYDLPLDVVEAGGRAAAACLDDPEFMRKPNRAGELAFRVFRAMVGAFNPPLPEPVIELREDGTVWRTYHFDEPL